MASTADDNLRQLLIESIESCLEKIKTQELGLISFDELVYIKSKKEFLIQNFADTFIGKVEERLNQQQQHIDKLEEEISYLKEINMAQRQMLEDSLDYLKSLHQEDGEVS